MWGGQTSDTQVLRAKQVESLRQYFPTVKEVVKDSLYDVVISLPTRRAITLRITLPRDFPRQPPALQVFPPVQHRFVDPQSFVTAAAHDNLARWPVHANLGKTLYEVVQKLIQEPPALLSAAAAAGPVQGVSGGVGASTLSSGSVAPSAVPPPQPVPQQLQSSPAVGYGAVSSYGAGPAAFAAQLPGAHPQQQPQQAVPPVSAAAAASSATPPPPTKHQTRMPDIPASFPELDGKTSAELATLINDEAAFQRFFEQLSAVQTMKRIRDDLRATAEDLARKNIAKEAEIERIRKEVATLSQTVSQRRSDFDSKVARQQQLAQRYSTAGLIELLSEAAAASERSSDAVADRFLAGDLDHKAFIKEFMEERKLFHLRSAKKESLMLMPR